MQGFTARLIATGIAVFLAIHVVPGIEARTWSAGLAAVILLALLNAVVRPFLYILSLPIILLTFGLFMVIINAVLLKLVAALVSGFVVTGWWPAIGGALIVSLVTALLAPWTGGVGEFQMHTRHESRRPPRIVN